MDDNGKVETSISDGIATVSFYHPQSNSLPRTLLRQLASEIAGAGENPEAHVIVLRSEGEKVFCAGASFDELVGIKNLEEGKNFFSGFAHVINAMRKAPKFVIGRIHGKAVGGGVGLACASDYALALDSSSIKLSELAVGIGPFVVGPAVERRVGPAAFSQLSMDATEWRTATWAKEHGLYAEIFSSIEELDRAVMTLAQKLAASNPEAMHELKKVFWSGTDHWDTLLVERAAISGRLVLSDFTRQAIEKFKASAKK